MTPRRSGPFGPYGGRGLSRLAQRRKREAESPGFLVCRSCDLLVPVAEIANVPTPYHVACVRVKNKESQARGREAAKR